MANEKILVVDDDTNICELLRLYLTKEGYQVTTANDGRIALVNETGALTATRNLSANGAGSIDLRTHGVGQAITLDGATLSSTSGQVQLIAGGNIATTTSDGSTTEIATAGNALLVAGGSIGADGRRIELAGVNTLAAQSTGAQWLRQTSGSFALPSLVAALALLPALLFIPAATGYRLPVLFGRAAIRPR